MTIDIGTASYFRSHGQQPRGRGAWAFDLIDASSNQIVETVFTPSMTYSDAKVWIKAHLRANWAEELATGYLDIEAGA